MICSNCGARIDDDSRFCAACGSKIEPAADTSGSDSSVKMYNIPAPVLPAAAPSVRKKFTLKVLIPVLAVVCAVIVVAAGVLAVKTSPKTISRIIKPLKWGMTSEAAAKALGKDTKITPDSEDKNTVRATAEYYDLYGVEEHFTVTATTENDKLSGIFIFTSIPDDLELYNIIIEDMTKTYGDPVESHDYSELIYAVDLSTKWNDGATTAEAYYLQSESDDEAGLLMLKITPSEAE